MIKSVDSISDLFGSTLTNISTSLCSSLNCTILKDFYFRFHDILCQGLVPNIINIFFIIGLISGFNFFGIMFIICLNRKIRQDRELKKDLTKEKIHNQVIVVEA